MANHKSAEKRHRQSIKKNERNKSAKTAIRTAVKKARAAIVAKDPKAVELARAAEKMLAKASSKGIVNKKAASRQTSRINSQAAKSSK